MSLEEVVGKIGGDPRGFLSAIDKAVMAIGGFDDAVAKAAKKAGKAFDQPRDALGRFTKAGGTATKTIGGFELSLGGAAVAAAALADKLGGLAVDALKGAISGVVDLTKESIALNRQLGVASAEVATLVDTSLVNVDELVSKAREVGRAFGVDAVESTKALYQTLSASVEPAKAIEVLRASAVGAQAGLANLAETVDVTTSVINAYGLQAGAAGAIQDALFSAVKRGKLTFEEINSAAGQIIPTAALAKVGFGEVSSALATLTRNGLTSSQAAVSLNQTINAFLKPARQAVAAADEIGFSLSAQTLQTRGLRGAFEDLSKSVAEQVRQGRNAGEIYAELFRDVRGLRAAAVLASEQGLQGLAADIEATANSSGVASEAAAKLAGTLDFKLNRAYSEFRAGLFEVGKPLAKFIDDAIEAQGGAEALASKIKGAFTTISENVQMVITNLGGVSGAVQTATAFASGALTTLGDVISGLRFPISFAVTQFKIFGDVAKINIGLVGTVASQAGAIFSKAAKFIVNRLADLADGFQGLGNFINKIPGAANFGKTIADNAAEAAKSLRSTASAIGDFEVTLNEARDSSIDLFQSGFSGLGDAITGFGDLNSKVDALGQGLRNAGKATLELGFGATQQVEKLTGTIAGTLPGFISTTVTRAIAEARKALFTPSLFGGIRLATANIPQLLKSQPQGNDLSVLFNPVSGSSAAKAAEALVEETKKAETLRTEVVKEASAARTMVERLTGQQLETAATTSGFRAAEALRSGFTAAESRLYEAARSFGGKAGFSFISAAAAGITEGFTREFKGPLGARAALEAQRASDRFLQGQFGFSSGSFGVPSGQTAIRVLGFSDGGFVPGVGRGDKVPAMLEPGELVVPRDQVDNFTAGNISITINAGNRDGKQLADELFRELKRRMRLGQF